MATYLVLNLVVLAAVIAMLKLRGALVWNRAMTITLAVLLATTAIFDSLIVAMGIVQYDAAQILGVTVGAAPVEDFFYAALAALLIPATWNALKKGKSRE